MGADYLHVFVSAENEEQANRVRDALMEKKLIPGGQIMQGPAKFWWKGDMVEIKDYCYVFSYTRVDFKEALIEGMKKVTEEEVPMVSFMPFEGNDELIRWLEETLGH